MTDMHPTPARRTRRLTVDRRRWRNETTPILKRSFMGSSGLCSLPLSLEASRLVKELEKEI